jgi:hypothetical protein
VRRFDETDERSGVGVTRNSRRACAPEASRGDPY